MPARRCTLQLAHEDLSVSAAVRTERVQSSAIEAAPELVPWDEVGDRPVVRQRYVKPTHETIEGEPALPSGTVGFRYVAEDGEEVPSEAVVSVLAGAEADGDDGDGGDGGDSGAGGRGEAPARRVEKRPTTVKAGAAVPVERWIDLADAEEYLVESTYELWGEEPADEIELQRMVAWIEEHGETPMLVWQLQPEFYRNWGIVVPRIAPDRSTFGVLVKTTRERLEARHPMPVRSSAEVETLEAAEESAYLEQEAPG